MTLSERRIQELKASGTHWEYVKRRMNKGFRQSIHRFKGSDMPQAMKDTCVKKTKRDKHSIRPLQTPSGIERPNSWRNN